MITAQSITLPSFTVNKASTLGTSLNYKFAKSIDWDDVRVTFYDTSGLLQVLLGWRQSVWSAASGIQAANTYKKTSQISTYLPDNSAVNSWTLVNSWPSAVRYGELTYTQSDAKVVTVDVTMDWALENPSGSTNTSYPPDDVMTAFGGNSAFGS